MISEDHYEQICRENVYRVKGMFYSEVYLFLQACASEAVNFIVESGVKNGMSTKLLASAWPGEIVSVDLKPAPLDAVFPGVLLVQGDSRTVIPKLLHRYPERRFGILIDGPKGDTALALRDACFRFPAARVIGIHDAPRSAVDADGWHSFDPCWSAQRERFDKYVSEHYRRKYPMGPGLAIWRQKERS